MQIIERSEKIVTKISRLKPYVIEPENKYRKPPCKTQIYTLYCARK